MKYNYTASAKKPAPASSTLAVLDVTKLEGVGVDLADVLKSSKPIPLRAAAILFVLTAIFYMRLQIIFKGKQKKI